MDLADFVALVDAADRATHGDLDTRAIITRLREHLDADEPGMDLDEFLAAYDAAHAAD